MVIIVIKIRNSLQNLGIHVFARDNYPILQIHQLLTPGTAHFYEMEHCLSIELIWVNFWENSFLPAVLKHIRAEN